MTIAEAKQVRIVDFLAQLGHHAQHIKSEQYWYFSPLRNERTPSFKVNDRINEWYDFGEATGGDLVELAKYICRTDCVSEALAYIERLVNGASLPRTRMPTAPPRPVEAEMKDVIVIPLRHHALFSYLQSRLIDADIGRMYCKEVHYELRGRHYFALAFGNTSGGYEVRNAYYKGCQGLRERSLPLGGAVAQRLRGYEWRSEKSVKAIAPTGAALAFLCFDFFFRIVKGKQPLARCGVGGVQR